MTDHTKTEWKAVAVIAGIWIVTISLAVVPFDNWGILGGLV